jgi:hypothetical protein
MLCTRNCLVRLASGPLPKGISVTIVILFILLFIDNELVYICGIINSVNWCNKSNMFSSGFMSMLVAL